MTIKRFGFVFLLLACVCMMCPLSWAQSTQGTILGTVKDSSGASIASATVKLTGVDTVFLPTGAEWAYVSSSLVREIAGLGGDITPFVPAAVADRITRRLAERNREHGREVRDL